VDSVIEVLTLQKKDVDTEPKSLITGRTDGIVGIAKHEKDLIVLLDIIKVLSADNMGNLNENVKGFQIQVQKATK
jgi:chemotaxis signal transduction protein